MKNLLKDIAYKPVDSDPTTYLKITTKNKIKNVPIDPANTKRMAPRQKLSKFSNAVD